LEKAFDRRNVFANQPSQDSHFFGTHISKDQGCLKYVLLVFFFVHTNRQYLSYFIHTDNCLPKYQRLEVSFNSIKLQVINLCSNQVDVLSELEAVDNFKLMIIILLTLWNVTFYGMSREHHEVNITFFHVFDYLFEPFV